MGSIMWFFTILSVLPLPSFLSSFLLPLFYSSSFVLPLYNPSFFSPFTTLPLSVPFFYPILFPAFFFFISPFLFTASPLYPLPLHNPSFSEPFLFPPLFFSHFLVHPSSLPPVLLCPSSFSSSTFHPSSLHPSSLVSLLNLCAPFVFLTLPLSAPSSPISIFLYLLSHTVPLSFHASFSFCFFISLFFVSFVFAMNSLPPLPLSTVSQVNTFFLFRPDFIFQLLLFHPVFFFSIL